MSDIPHIKKTVRTPRVTFCYKYYSSRYGKRSGTRAERRAPTTEQQKIINKRHSQQKKLWTICNNFKHDDYFLTFTYRRGNRPENMDEAIKNTSKAMARLSRLLKNKGIKLSYFLVTERGERGGVHHHVLIRNNFDIGLLFSRRIWTHGAVKLQDVYTKSILELAKYMLKGDSEKSEKRYSKSRDVVAPEPRVEVIKSKRWTDKPRPKKGYDIIDICEGTDMGFGFPYQEYIMVRRE